MARDSKASKRGSRRSYPRIQLHRPAPIRLSNGELMADSVRDVSCGGLQLWCSRQFALAIHPTQALIVEQQWPKTVLAISFPYPDDLPEIVVQCSLRYLRGIGNDEFSLGLQFDEFRGNGAAGFQRFIETSSDSPDA